jgi:glycosyltransferase involved in cell wall biosynthesis
MNAGVAEAKPVRAQAPPPRRAMARTPRVLQVVLSLTPGGTERLVVEICRRLAPEFGVAVCCLDAEGEWAVDLQARGIEVTALHRRPGFRPQVGRAIAQLARERQIDVLHCHQYSPFVYGRLASMWDRHLKIVYTEHGRLSDAPPTWKRRLVNPWLSRFDGSIVAVSHELRDYMIDARFPPGRVQVVHNGVEPADLPSREDRRRARQQLGLDDRAFVVATVARLDPVKDLMTLFEAFAAVRRQAPSAQLLVVGDGPERDRLTARAAQPDLAGAVHMAGYRSDVRALLPAADVYASSSISEGVSITILEAMAAGIPVVATAVGGTPEVLPDASAGGILVPCRNPERLAEAIASLALDQRQRTAMAVAGRRRLERSFTIDRMVDDYARLYRGLAG